MQTKNESNLTRSIPDGFWENVTISSFAKQLGISPAKLDYLIQGEMIRLVHYEQNKGRYTFTEKWRALLREKFPNALHGAPLATQGPARANVSDIRERTVRKALVAAESYGYKEFLATFGPDSEGLTGYWMHKVQDPRLDWFVSGGGKSKRLRRDRVEDFKKGYAEYRKSYEGSKSKAA